MSTKHNMDVKKSFNWLRRESRGPTYISFSAFSDRPACSFDFGDEGYAASCNYGGELLQMSARDDSDGLVFAHGDFERTYYSSLARAQRKNGRQATFGLGIARNQKLSEHVDDKSKRGSNLEIGEMIERGCFNYRWPFNEYVLLLNEGDGPSDMEAGTCTRVSFVKDGILYQVMRLEKGCRPEADVCHYTSLRGRVTLSVGGLVRFGALNTNDPYTKPGQSTPESDCLSLKGSSNQLDIRVRQLVGGKYESLNLYLPNNKEGYGIGDSVGTYRAYADMLNSKDEGFEDRYVTFIAEFKLRRAGGKYQWPPTPDSEAIYRHLGIDSCSEKATGMMWETIFLQREEKSNYFSELSEVNLVGRCVEKILTVDLVPAIIRKKGRALNNEQPLSLMSNIFVQPSVDLESLFWKVRFLVKVYRFLFSFKKSHPQRTSDDESLDNSTDPKSPHTTKVDFHEYIAKSACDRLDIIKGTVNFQMERLQVGIQGVITFLVRTFIQPDTYTSPQSLELKVFQSNYYYVMITIWYVVKTCETYDFEWKWIDDEYKSWPTKDCLLLDCLPPDNLLPEKREKERAALLKWYHYASILNLTAEGRKHLPKAWADDNLERKVIRLERDARRVAAAKLLSRHPYSAEDEIIDRLGFLAEPLHAEFSRDSAGSVSSITSRRNLLGAEKGPTSGPWEIYALCYHSRLLVENHQYNRNDEETREQKAEDVENLSHSVLGEDEYSFISVGGN
ncbi:hypothetical protein F5B19DRAFT_486192 [Rostrohypoxylon terebratum]|nr:hypothetical protein F5B19DRAFT_486192 [Rostrohypoxylon terebratum]